MELSPEERRKIYEQEKARLEAREELEREKRGAAAATSVNLDQNVAGLLCYLGAWVTGIIFLVLEQKNNWVRFHAAQSIVVFGSLTIAGIVLGWIPYAGPVFSVIIGILSVIFWIFLMVKAYNSEYYKVAWAGEFAEKMIGLPVTELASVEPVSAESGSSQTGAAEDKAGTETSISDKAVGMLEDFSKHTEEFFKRKREGRVIGSAVIIVINIALLVFFNFFNEYVAYYNADTVNGAIVWTRAPFFTREISQWLPIFNTTLGISIAVHTLLIIFDWYRIRRPLLFIVDALALATVITLLSVFPFNFNIIPNDSAAIGAQIGVIVVLVGITIGMGISLVVRVFKLLIYLSKYQEDIKKSD